MFKKYLVGSLIVLMFNLAGGGLLFAQTREDAKSAKLTAKIKTKVAKFGTGAKSKVKVEFRNQNQTDLKGYISAIDDDSFTVTDKKTGATTKIDYAQVKKVNRPGLSTGVKIAIAAAVAVPVIILLRIYLIYCHNEGC
ncbi:MAG TPA: hypothetical protein VNB22_12855 [Pyrinomonadaceae bacterium]|jgi:hypothetical protein|nr:hypothetical protein [Pyrinomonadaceae bacterium]